MPAPKRRRSSTAWIVTVVALAVAATAAALGVILVAGGDGSSVGLANNSFSLVGASGNASAPLLLEESPFGVAVAGDTAWLPRYSDDTILSVDTATDRTQLVQVGDGPAEPWRCTRRRRRVLIDAHRCLIA